MKYGHGLQRTLLAKVAVALFIFLLGGCTGTTDSVVAPDEDKKVDPDKDVSSTIDLEEPDLATHDVPAVKLKLNSVSPNSGGAEGGMMAALKGSGFLYGARVYFGEAEASSVLVETAFLITCIVPEGAPGKVDVKVVLPDGRLDVLEAAFSYLEDEKPPLEVTSILPESGPETGGFLCVLSGKGFEAGMSIRLGANAAESITVISDTAAHFIAPEGNPGIVNVIVKLGDDTAVLPDAFEYTVAEEKEPLTLSGISPTKGPLEGGILALLTGKGFEAGMTVQFGEETASVLDVSSTNSLTVEVPPGAEGQVDVIATLGDEVAILYGGFEYVADTTEDPLTLSSIQPESGPTSGGFLCVLGGTGFGSGMKVYLGDKAAAFVNVMSSDVVAFMAPPGEAGTVDVAVALGGEEATIEDGFTFVSAEELSLVAAEPATGPVAGGTLVLLKGSGFNADTQAYFGGMSAQVVEVPSSGFMAVLSPVGAGPGLVDVVVTNPDGASATLEQGFEYTELETLSINSIQPSTGSMDGGYLTMLGGTGFKSGMTVHFCDTASDNVQVLSNQAVVATVPAHGAGTCDVTLENVSGDSTVLPLGFTYTQEVVSTEGPVVGLVKPKKGPVDGGTWVLVSGQNFAPGAVVAFGANSATQSVWVSNTQLLAMTPPSPPGYATVTVTNPDTKSSSLSSAFQFIVAGDSPLGLTSIIPGSGPSTGGTLAVITGENFKPGLAVYIGAKPVAAVKYLSSTQVSVTVPAGPAGPATVIAVNPDGSTDSLVDGFAWFEPQEGDAPPPAIAGVFPEYGSANGGAKVTILGSSFQQDAQVFFDGSPVGVDEVQGSGQILITTPAHPAGSVDVAVVNPDGQTAVKPGGYVYFVSPPFIGNVVPDHGPVNGGTPVTITGSGFSSGLKLYWDGELAGGLIVNPPDEIKLTTVPHDAGAVSLMIVNPDGLTAQEEQAFTYEAEGETLPPVVESLSPAHGSAIGGYQVIVNGANFMDGATIKFGTKSGTGVKFLSPAALVAQVPAGQPGAAVDVTVKNPDGQQGLLEEGFSYDAVEQEDLNLISVMPSFGPSTGGTSVALVGTGFSDGDTAVFFGAKESTNVTAVSNNLLTATTPGGPPGPVTVKVERGGEQSSLQAAFLYVETQPQSTPPLVLAVMPSAGPETGGTLVQIVGANFKQGAIVLFGGEEALSVDLDTEELLLVETPPSGAGTVSVVVVNPDGLADILPAAFTYYGQSSANPPVVAGVVPDFGSALGGDIVTVAGANFSPGLSCYICGNPASDIQVVSQAQFTARTPAGPVGKCKVKVVNPDGQAGSLDGGFTYLAPQPELENVVPGEGPVEGGIDVVIYGANFMAGMQVWFGVSQSQSVTLFSADTASVKVPPGLPGVVDVKVVNAGGLMAILEDGFKYSEDPQIFPAPKLKALVPASGPITGGTVVSFQGEDFQDGAKVLFSGLQAEVSFLDSTSLLVVTPPGNQGGVDVTVLNPDGQGSTLPDGFVYVLPTAPKPKLFGVVPASGPEAGGTTILVTGSNLTSEGMLYIDMKPVGQFTFLNDSVVSAVTPKGMPGPASVSFVGADGQEASLPNGYTYIPAPKIESISPQMGPIEGGTEVTMVGQNFQPGAQLWFGPYLASNVVVENSLIIHVDTPGAGAPGTVDVKIINGDGQSGTLTKGYTYMLAPELSGIVPKTGPVTGGTPVSITGANFAPGVVVKFGIDECLDLALVDSAHILCSTPPGPEGLVDVVAVNLDGQTAVLGQAFEYLLDVGLDPVLELIEPAAGPETGDTLVTIYGENLGTPGAILMGQTPVTQFVSAAADAVVFKTPVHEPGIVDVTFISEGGDSAKLVQAFEYIEESQLADPPEVVAIVPKSGPTKGGTIVTVTGANYQDGAVVFFGGKKGASTTFVNEAQLEAQTPPHDKALVGITVLNPDGQTIMVPEAYTFVPPPVMESVEPSAGSPQGGTTVTITGQEFFAGATPSTQTSVHICADFAAQTGCEKVLAQSIVEISTDTIVFTTPAHIPGFVDLGVVNPDGQKHFMGGVYYFNDPPMLDSITPEAGPAGGGTKVTVLGTGFVAGMEVFFGGVASPDVTPKSDKETLAITPPGAGGLVEVSVENPDGALDSLGDAYTYVEAPIIDKFFPTSGPEEGGTQVTVEGQFFWTDNPGSTVTIGGVPVPAEDTQVVSSTVVIIQTPPGEGPAAITVSNPDGQSATAKDSFVYVPPAPAPTISFVIPSYGSANGGEIVSIIGTAFMDGAQVYFGEEGAWVQATNAKVKNLGTMVTCVSPPHDVGVVDVRVVNTNQQEVIREEGFEFKQAQQLPPLAFTSATPNRGPITGGGKVTISGKGFKSGITVFFGKAPNWEPGTETQYLGPTILHTIVPASQTGDPGYVDIMLLNPSAPEVPDSHVATDAYAYTSGGVFELKGLRIPPDGRTDHRGDAADFNNDGLPDISIMRNGYQSRGELFINTKPAEWGFAGWFVKLTDFTNWTHSQPYTVIGDFDGDGDLDLGQRRADRFSLERNNGDGTFTGAEDKGFISNEGREMAAADFNCDGYLDVFVSTRSTSSSRPNRILVNDGLGNFDHYTTNALPAQYEHTEHAAAADVDLDGDIDLILANNDAMQNRLYFNNCANIDLPPVCAVPMCKMKEYNGHRYAICTDGRTWYSAKSKCEANGYHLAVINDQEEQNWLNSSGIAQSNFWIGYSDKDEEGVWQWYGDDSDFTYWGGGQPDNSGTTSHCAVYRWWGDGRWNDTNCYEGRQYICETDKLECPVPWGFTDAQYGPGKNFPISGFNTRWIAMVDLDNNFYPDAIVANWGQQTRVYMNYGGNFDNDDLAHWPQGEANPNIDRLYPVDIDLDGDIDMVAQIDSSGYRWARVYLNDKNNGGSGTLTLLEDALPDRRGDTRSMVVADFDDDLLPDIYVVNQDHNDLLLINNGFADNTDWTDDNRVGPGKFWYNTQHGIPEHIDGTEDVQAGDLDGDGDLDIVKANWKWDRLSVFMNSGDGSFRDESADRMPQVSPYFMVTYHNLELADLDNDGDLDVITGGYKGCEWSIPNEVGQVRIFLNDGDGFFTNATAGNVPFVSDHSYRYIKAADINGDGKTDIFAGGWYWCYGDQRFMTLINGGDPFDTGEVYFFNQAGTWFPTQHRNSSEVFLTDLNGDGKIDLYMGRGHGGYQNRVYHNDGKKLVDMTNTHLPSVADDTRAVQVADFDADGDLDLYSGNWGQDRMYLQEIDGTFSDVTTSNVPGSGSGTLDMGQGDFNGDGLPDLFIVNNDEKNEVYLNEGLGKMVNMPDNLPWSDDWGRGAAVGDFDGDGDLDVYVSNSGLDRLYFNTSN